MPKIKLTQGRSVLVDDSDFEYLNQWKWHYMNAGYAARDAWVNGKNVKTLMHRVIMELHKGDKRLVDHINRDTLDNRRSNLRVCDKSLNALNSKIPIQNTSGTKHIGFDRARNKWRYAIKVHGKFYSKRYQTFEEALAGLNQKKEELCLSFL